MTNTFDQHSVSVNYISTTSRNDGQKISLAHPQKKEVSRLDPHNTRENARDFPRSPTVTTKKILYGDFSTREGYLRGEHPGLKCQNQRPAYVSAGMELEGDQLKKKWCASRDSNPGPRD